MTGRAWRGLCAGGLAMLVGVACDTAPVEPTGSYAGEDPKPGPMVAGRKPPKAERSVGAEPSKTVAWTRIDGGDAVAAVQQAAKDAKGVPVAYVGATWCGPCKVYKKSLDDPRMVQAHRPVHIIELDADAHASALQTLGVAPKGVPHWEMLDKAGAPVGKTIDGSAWDDNTVENMAPALSGFFTGG